MSWTNPPAGAENVRADELKRTRRLFDLVLKRVSKKFIKHGEIDPTVLVEVKGHLTFIPPFGPTKAIWIETIRDFLAREHAPRYVMAFEAFYLDAKASDAEKMALARLVESGIKQVSDLDCKREAIYINAEDRYGNSIIGHREITRDSQGRPHLGELKLIDQSDMQSSGLMVSLLKKGEMR